GTPSQGNPVCPVASAIPSGVMVANQSGIGKSYRIESDVPVVAYQINPYGGGSAAVTGASLLLPTSAWDTNYVAINAYESGPHNTSMNVVAHQDGTQVTMVPVAAVAGGGGLPATAANTPFNFTLNAGEHAQFTQAASLTGSVIQADKPIGFMAGSRCSFVPSGVYACDHCEQMIPPVRALGSEYVGVMHRQRGNEPAVWRILGAVDGTTLTWSTDVGGPAAVDQGQLVEFQTAVPFVVTSQDDDHPFLLMSHMSGGSTNGMGGYGDADSVISVPPAQYMSKYVFFADPTYPETNLVVVRAPHEGEFKDVNLDCAGNLTGWQAVGPYEWTRIDLITGDFQPVGNCSTGRHEMTSEGRFGLWVWGWGTTATSVFTAYVSYGYPGGMNVEPINQVVVPPVPR
ncbi:MAG: IgGFc-binding protein, partial [Deltaproteobacteria bacterium]|nr:IgGFc-binding protein [Deltaproteobacteria bacterium]